MRARARFSARWLRGDKLAWAIEDARKKQGSRIVALVERVQVAMALLRLLNK